MHVPLYSSEITQPCFLLNSGPPFVAGNTVQRKSLGFGTVQTSGETVDRITRWRVVVLSQF